jgi:hypothetical protein
MTRLHTLATTSVTGHFKTSQPGSNQNRKASHSARRFCGRRFVGLGFALLIFVPFPGNGGVVFEPSSFFIKSL